MFLFAIMGFSQQINVDLLRVLLSFALLPAVRDLTPPTAPSYTQFQVNEAPVPKRFIELMGVACVPFEDNGTRRIPGQLAQSRINHNSNSMQALADLVTSMLSQWPRVEIDTQQLIDVDPALLDRSLAVQAASGEWVRLSNNFVLSQFLQKVQNMLNEANASPSSEDSSPAHTIDPDHARRAARKSAFGDTESVADLY